ncbi:GDSL-type esterase/lipase family protein [Fusibacter bizertensis]
MQKIMYKVLLLSVSIALIALLIGFTESQKRSIDYIFDNERPQEQLTETNDTTTSTDPTSTSEATEVTTETLSTAEITEPSETTAEVTTETTTETTSLSSTEKDLTNSTEPMSMVYDYSQPVPQSDTVDDTYFDDAIFVGNSRTEGFMLYSGLKNTQALTHIGLKVDTIKTSLLAKVNGKKMTIMGALKLKKFKKIYIMLGMNELGWAFPELFKEEYASVIDEIKENHPDSIIYMQSILPVTKAKALKDPIYNNENIDKFNKLVKEIAYEKEVYYLDVAEGVADDEGNLPENGTFDGVHLKPDFCLEWLAYLKDHTVEGEK